MRRGFWCTNFSSGFALLQFTWLLIKLYLLQKKWSQGSFLLRSPSWGRSDSSLPSSIRLLLVGVHECTLLVFCLFVPYSGCYPSLSSFVCSSILLFLTSQNHSYTSKINCFQWTMWTFWKIKTIHFSCARLRNKYFRNIFHSCLGSVFIA